MTLACRRHSLTNVASETQCRRMEAKLPDCPMKFMVGEHINGLVDRFERRRRSKAR